jgi:hypothetical protein
MQTQTVKIKTAKTATVIYEAELIDIERQILKRYRDIKDEDDEDDEDNKDNEYDYVFLSDMLRLVEIIRDHSIALA